MATRDRTRSSRFRRLLIRWAGQSKPTEWILAFTGLIGVLATIGGAYFLVKNGFLDQKKSELEVKKSELSIQNTKLEMEQMSLIVKREWPLSGQIAEYTKQLATAEDRIKAAEAKFEVYAKHEEVAENARGYLQRNGEARRDQTRPHLRGCR